MEKILNLSQDELDIQTEIIKTVNWERVKVSFADMKEWKQ